MTIAVDLGRKAIKQTNKQDFHLVSYNKLGTAHFIYVKGSLRPEHTNYVFHSLKIILTLYLKEAPFNAFANSSSCLIRSALFAYRNMLYLILHKWT